VSIVLRQSLQVRLATGKPAEGARARGRRGVGQTELARGVRPAQLDEGLTPSLRQLPLRAPLPVEVEAVGRRFPEPVEAAAYFIASDGLTNAIKHANASKVLVSGHRDDAASAASLRGLSLSARLDSVLPLRQVQCQL
jgi:hypothetical protein